MALFEVERARGKVPRGKIVLRWTAFALLGVSACGGGPLSAAGPLGTDDRGSAVGAGWTETRAGVLLGAWSEELDAVDARTIELMKMALEHPHWKTKHVRRLRLPPDESANLEAFLGLLRFDPEARGRLRKAVSHPGMRARFTERAVFLGRDDMEDVQVGFRVLGMEGPVVRVVLEGAQGDEPTEIELLDDDHFRAPWGAGQAPLTFVRKKGEGGTKAP